MIDRVFLLIDARRNHLKLTFRSLCGEEAAFAGCMAACLHQQVLVVTSLADSKIEAFVLLFVNHHIVRSGVAQTMPEEVVMPLRYLVLSGVEECLRVCSPGNRTHAFRSIWQVQAGRKIADMQR